MIDELVSAQDLNLPFSRLRWWIAGCVLNREVDSALREFLHRCTACPLKQFDCLLPPRLLRRTEVFCDIAQKNPLFRQRSSDLRRNLALQASDFLSPDTFTFRDSAGEINEAERRH